MSPVRCSARVRQTCVVTLELLFNDIDEPVDVDFAPTREVEAAADGSRSCEVTADEPEPLIGNASISALLATEFLILAIDPYPRKPGASFDAPAPTADPAAHPFAATRCVAEKQHSQEIIIGGVPFVPRRANRYSPRRRGTPIRQSGQHSNPMAQKVRIALDAMGGDFGPAVVVPGADLALARHPDTEFLFFGDEALIAPLLVETRARLNAASRIVHTDVVVKMDDKPSQALRHGRWKSSMWLAIDAVKKGEADVAVSAGNTGALMAMAKFNLRTMPGIERPAIAGLWPTLKGDSVVLDVGASIGADADHLVDLAVMGSAMARVLFDLERPTVGLLNIGVEEVKGLEAVREAGKIPARGELAVPRLCRLRRGRRDRQGEWPTWS